MSTKFLVEFTLLSSFHPIVPACLPHDLHGAPAAATPLLTELQVGSDVLSDTKPIRPSLAQLVLKWMRRRRKKESILCLNGQVVQVAMCIAFATQLSGASCFKRGKEKSFTRLLPTSLCLAR